MDDGLNVEECRIVQAGRMALASTIERLAPERAMPLVCAAVAGSFADILCASAGARELTTVINTQLREAGWKLVPLRNA